MISPGRIPASKAGPLRLTLTTSQALKGRQVVAEGKAARDARPFKSGVIIQRDLSVFNQHVHNADYGIAGNGDIRVQRSRTGAACIDEGVDTDDLGLCC